MAEFVTLGRYANQDDNPISREQLTHHTGWLTLPIELPNEEQLSVRQALDLAFVMRFDVMDRKMREARDLAKITPISGEDLTEPIGDAPMDTVDEELMLDWYKRLCPRIGTRWQDTADYMCNYMKKHKRLTDRIKELRLRCFAAFSSPEIHKWFWEKMIIGAAVSKDKVDPEPLFCYVLSRSVEEQLKKGLVAAKFEDYIEIVEPHVQFVRDTRPMYVGIKQWAMTYEVWRATRTKGQLCRYKAMRVHSSHPLGAQMHWERLMRLRRALMAWTIRPPSELTTLPASWEKRQVVSAVDLNTDCSLHDEKRHLKVDWFWEVLQPDSRRHPKMTKRNMSENRVELLEKEAEYATFYSFWLNYMDRPYTVLEAVEIAYFGFIHKIEADEPQEEYALAMDNLLKMYEACDTKIPGFPPIREWAAQMLQSMLNRKYTDAECKALGVMHKIYLQQAKIDELQRFKDYNERQVIAGQRDISYEEWQALPTDLKTNKISYLTGAMLVPGQYSIVAVENSSNNRIYRLIQRMKKNLMKELSLPDEEELKQQPAQKVHCEVCNDELCQDEAAHLMVCPKHVSAVRKMKNRKHAGEVKADVRYAAHEKHFVQLVDEWAHADLDLCELKARMKLWVKRRKGTQ